MQRGVPGARRAGRTRRRAAAKSVARTGLKRAYLHPRERSPSVSSHGVTSPAPSARAASPARRGGDGKRRPRGRLDRERGGDRREHARGVPPRLRRRPCDAPACEWAARAVRRRRRRARSRSPARCASRCRAASAGSRELEHRRALGGSPSESAWAPAAAARVRPLVRPALRPLARARRFAAGAGAGLAAAGATTVVGDRRGPAPARRGGYAFPFNVPAALLAIPIFLARELASGCAQLAGAAAASSRASSVALIAGLTLAGGGARLHARVA